MTRMSLKLLSIDIFLYCADWREIIVRKMTTDKLEGLHTIKQEVTMKSGLVHAKCSHLC